MIMSSKQSDYLCDPQLFYVFICLPRNCEGNIFLEVARFILFFAYLHFLFSYIKHI